MKQTATRYTIIDKTNNLFLERVVYMGHDMYDWQFTDKAVAALQASREFLKELLPNKKSSDLEIRELKITYEY